MGVLVKYLYYYFETMAALMSLQNVHQSTITHKASQATTSTRVAFSSLSSSHRRSRIHHDRALSTGGFPISASTASRPKVLIIQNDLLCSPCTAIASLIAHDMTYHVIYAFHDNAFKFLQPLHYTAMIVLGGRLAVYDSCDCPFLEIEMRFIEKALRQNVPILGICLGCQLLAKCVGGAVHVGAKGIEIGYKHWNFGTEKTNSGTATDANDATENKTDETEIETEIESCRNAMSELRMNRVERSRSVNFLDLEPTSKPSIHPKLDVTVEEPEVIFLDDDDDDDESDEESEDDFNEEEMFEDEANDDKKETESIDDPMVSVLSEDALSKFIILFHGDTFSLPERCAVTGHSVELLATTDQYNALFRVGKLWYGFQGHPELTYDMLSVWCKCWGDEWLAQWKGGDLQKDVIEYAQRNQHKIKAVGRRVFDIWCREIVLKQRRDGGSLVHKHLYTE